MTKPPRRPSGTVAWDPATEEPLLVPEEETRPFNPLDTRNLAIAVAKALLEEPARPLAALPPFRGAGIYVIYYGGALPIYAPLAVENRDMQRPRRPIYIGKAIPPGARRGALVADAIDTNALHGRLRQHADSIGTADNLRIDDFACRFLIVQDLWIPLAEQLLITHFAPVWNRIMDGFGNHDPGAGRHQGLRPRWDVLHPGRPWATRLRPRNETAEDIGREVEQYLAAGTPTSFSGLPDDFVSK